MTAPLWPELEALFHEALARSSAERAAWFAARCAGRPELRAQIDAMLRAHDEAGSLTAVPGFGAPLTKGARLGAYEIQGPLGAGGMGEKLSRARHAARPRRRHQGPAARLRGRRRSPRALRARGARPGRAQSPEHRRDLRDRRRSAALDGARAGEAGHHVRALVLELVEGDTLAERIARGPMPVGEALVIARQIAEALVGQGGGQRRQS